MSIDWSGKLRSRAGKPVTLLFVDGWQKATGNTKRRCLIEGIGSIACPHVVLADENGRVMGDGSQSDWDIMEATEQ